MKIQDYGQGIYTLFKGELPAEMKTYDGWTHTGWQPVIIAHVMLRKRDKTGYYIVKGDFGRRDGINEFRVDGKSLKSHLMEATDESQI